MTQLTLEGSFPAIKTLFEDRLFTNPEKRTPIAILEWFETERARLYSSIYAWQPIVKAKLELDQIEEHLYLIADLELCPTLPYTLSQQLEPVSKRFFFKTPITRISLFGYLRATAERHLPEARPRIEIVFASDTEKYKTSVCCIIRYPDLDYWTLLMTAIRSRVLAQGFSFLKWTGSEKD
jgi:hypothetical protein